MIKPCRPAQFPGRAGKVYTHYFFRAAKILIITMVGAGVVQGTDPVEHSKGSSVIEPLTNRLVFTQVPVQTAADIAGKPAAFIADSALPDGSRIVLFDPANPDHDVTNLTSDFTAAGQPDLSFDGQRILFVGKQSPDEPFDVWEINTDGSSLRRITKHVGNCITAIYLSTIYTIDADEPVNQIAFCSEADDGAGHSLYTCRMDGTRIRRITFNPHGASDPCLLSDGRLLFSSRQPPAPGHGFGIGSALFTVNTDGTDVFVFAAAHESPAIRSMPCETPDGWVVYVESVIGGGDGGGSLIAVPATRSLRQRRVVASDQSGLYHSPSALADGGLLVSYRNAASGSYGIYVLDSQSGNRVAGVYDAPQWHDLDAEALRPRPVPAGRSSVVDERVETGFLYCLNAYLSDTTRSKRIAKGQIQQLQVYRPLTKPNSDPNDSPVEKRVDSDSGIIEEELLGSVTVESDGSFYLRVPARTPLRLQTLNAEGEVLQAMRNWIWVMPREARGCIGCHEDRELTPPNRHVLALRKPPQLVGVTDNEPAGGAAASPRTKGDPK